MLGTFALCYTSVLCSVLYTLAAKFFEYFLCVSPSLKNKKVSNKTSFISLYMLQQLNSWLNFASKHSNRLVVI